MFMGPEKKRELVIRNRTMADGMWPIILVCDFPTKTMGIIEMSLGIMWENTAPGTEFSGIFCAGIGLLQLSVVDLFANDTYKLCIFT